MGDKARVTIALPFIILLAGIIIPLLSDAGSDLPDEVSNAAVASYAGRTAAEWGILATDAIERGAHDRALSCAKSAERVEPGEQFGGLLKEIRVLRWRSRGIARSRDRFFGGEVVAGAYGDSAVFIPAHRVTVALPGESLWKIAISIVAADCGELARDTRADSRDIYAVWDGLTELNGVRELEVGERVLLPIPVGEASWFRDLALEAARGHRFALADSAAIEAVRRGEPRVLLGTVSDRKREWEDELVIEAHTIVERALGLSRVSEHGEFIDALREAHRALDEAEGLSMGTQHEQLLVVVEAMIAEAERFRFREDGAVRVMRPAGESYTEAAREAIEWLLERSLDASGASYPHSADKTDDQLAWAMFMKDAYDLARSEGVDFTALLENVVTDSEMLLPNPELYFAAR
jgi:hypothetical protein